VPIAVYTCLRPRVAATAEHLESISDTGKFEILATQVLRFLYEDCRAIVHLGVNPEGKTIPSPVDGFVHIPNRKPNRYVMTAFTTSADLKRKWLSDSEKSLAKTTEEGDLPKAAKLAAAIRLGDSEAEFCLYLGTNRTLSIDLMNEVYAVARQARISVEFLEQSKLRDFLDGTADGQWLRQKHLEITAERLSNGLLRHLSAASLTEYRSDAPLGGAALLVRTAACEVANRLLRESSTSLVLLVGPSGAGKTVLAQTVLAEYLDCAGIGFWVPAEVAERAVSLAEALTKTLRSLHGRLDLDAGRTALQLATEDQPLWIVIDDVNRSGQPSRALEKIISWARPAAEGQKTQTSFRILCPVWEFHSSIVELKYRSSDYIRLQRVRSFSRKESVAYLEKILHASNLKWHPAKLDGYAESLRDDPILLGLFSEILTREKPQEPEPLANNIIGHYVETSLQQLAAESGEWVNEYSDALHAVAHKLLVHKRLHAKRRELAAWFPAPSNVISLLKKLTTSGRICRAVSRDNGELVEFRHDRILEYFLAGAARAMLTESGDPPDALTDPFFAPQIGIAVASGQLPTPKLDWLLANNPMTLVTSLASLPILSNGAAEITSRVHRWLCSRENRGKVQREVALYLLAETNSQHVLSVTENLPNPGPHLWEARLRNGDALGGAYALSVDFYPRMHHSWLESLISDAQEKHGLQLSSDLRQHLQEEGTRGPLLRGALTLAGYLADPFLADAIIKAFEKAPESDQTLACFLWAGLRCGGEKAEVVLLPMMQKLLTVDSASTPSTLSRRDQIEEALAFSGRHGFPNSVLAYLTELGERQEYRWIVASILRSIDHPMAITFMVRTIAERKAQMDKRSFFPYASIWRDQWRRDTESHRLSEASLAALRELWSNPASPDWLQKYAFEIWAEYTDDLPTLREVGVKGSPFADLSLKRRTIKGDSTAAPAVKAHIIKNELRAYWLQFLHHVWQPDFEEMLDDLLMQAFPAGEQTQKPWSDENFQLAHVLRDIPTEPAERLLLNHWRKFMGIPVFIQAALYLSTENTRTVAAQAIAAIGAGPDPFEHLGSFFGFKTFGLRDRLRFEHIESLRPYLEKIGAMTIFELAEWCFRNGFRSWALANVKPVSGKRLRYPKLDDERDSAMMARTRARWFPTTEDLFRQFTAGEGADSARRLFHCELLFDEWIDAGQMPQHFFELLEAWVTSAPSESRRATALAALQIRGCRADLKRLCACFTKSNLEVRDPLIEQVTYLIRRRTLD